MVQMSIVDRHFAGVTEFVAIDDDLGVQLRSESGPGMEPRHLLHSAIVCRPDIHRHLIGVRILAAVEPDIRFSPRFHDKEQ